MCIICVAVEDVVTREGDATKCPPKQERAHTLWRRKPFYFTTSQSAIFWAWNSTLAHSWDQPRWWKLLLLILKIIQKRNCGESHQISGPTIVKLAKIGLCRKIARSFNLMEWKISNHLGGLPLRALLHCLPERRVCRLCRSCPHQHIGCAVPYLAVGGGAVSAVCIFCQYN